MTKDPDIVDGKRDREGVSEVRAYCDRNGKMEVHRGSETIVANVTVLRKVWTL